MTKVAIFTPTQRPGIDVTHHSILRQKFTEDVELLWVVSDELYHHRSHVFANFAAQDKKNKVYDYKYFLLQKKHGYKRNLAASYNKAIRYARDWDADLFISLQDYIYVPEDGIQKFINMWKDVENDESIDAIYTGICSISDDPYDEEVHDTGGMYTIFKESYNKRPGKLEWVDCRFRSDSEYRYQAVNPIEWETNWACIPRKALHDEHLEFDEEYDKAVAFENQDYAFQAKKAGYQVLIDFNNDTISLPHKRYFADEWAEEKPLTEVNRVYSESKWASP